MRTLIVTIVGLIIVAGGIYIYRTSSGPVKSAPEGVVCTMEAKLCPDGSYVGRTGPNCEFAACPGATSTKNTTY